MANARINKGHPTVSFSNIPAVANSAKWKKDRTMKHMATLILAAIAITSCAASHQGYLLRTDTGQRGTVVFHDNSSAKRGNVEAVLANGEQCQGQFNTIPDQLTRNWEDPSIVESEDSQIGVAVFDCANNHVVKCNFSRAQEGNGSGQCSDNLGRKYSLNF